METVFTRLDQEWEALSRTPSIRTDLAEACAIAGVRSPSDLIAAVRRLAAPEADAVLACLAAAAHEGSKVAARALLQLLLPGTCRLAARWWALGTSEERAAAAVAAVYERIRHYPFDRRPSKIAANVLLDANQDLARSARKLSEDRQRTAPTEPDRLVGRRAEEVVSAADELRDVIDDAVAAGQVPANWAALIIATHIEGDDLPSIARRTGTPVRTLQWRRRAAEAALVAGAAA